MPPSTLGSTEESKRKHATKERDKRIRITIQLDDDQLHSYSSLIAPHHHTVSQFKIQLFEIKLLVLNVCWFGNGLSIMINSIFSRDSFLTKLQSLFRLFKTAAQFQKSMVKPASKELTKHIEHLDCSRRKLASVPNLIDVFNKVCQYYWCFSRKTENFGTLHMKNIGTLISYPVK